jgi:hypothetical protein
MLEEIPAERRPSGFEVDAKDVNADRTDQANGQAPQPPESRDVQNAARPGLGQREQLVPDSARPARALACPADEALPGDAPGPERGFGWAWSGRLLKIAGVSALFAAAGALLGAWISPSGKWARPLCAAAGAGSATYVAASLIADRPGARS